jgi:hypothetical protein
LAIFQKAFSASSFEWSVLSVCLQIVGRHHDGGRVDRADLLVCQLKQRAIKFTAIAILPVPF